MSILQHDRRQLCDDCIACACECDYWLLCVCVSRVPLFIYECDQRHSPSECVEHNQMIAFIPEIKLQNIEMKQKTSHITCCRLFTNDNNIFFLVIWWIWFDDGTIAAFDYLRWVACCCSCPSSISVWVCIRGSQEISRCGWTECESVDIRQSQRRADGRWRGPAIAHWVFVLYMTGFGITEKVKRTNEWTALCTH